MYKANKGMTVYECLFLQVRLASSLGAVIHDGVIFFLFFQVPHNQLPFQRLLTSVKRSLLHLRRQRITLNV